MQCINDIIIDRLIFLFLFGLAHSKYTKLRVYVQQRTHACNIVGYVKHSNRESTFWG